MSNSIIEEKNILLSSSGPGPVQVQSQSNLKRSLKISKDIKDLEQEHNLNSLCHPPPDNFSFDSSAVTCNLHSEPQDDSV